MGKMMTRPIKQIFNGGVMKNLNFFLFTITLALQPLTIQAQNLIYNPGCEDSLVNGEIPYWTEVIGTDWSHRANGNPPSYEGDYMFFPGAVPIAELQQDIDVSSNASAIDSSIQYYYFEGYIRAYNQNPPDHSRIVLEYLDTLKTTKLDSIDLGEYFSTTDWLQLTDTTLAPIGTRFIRIRLISTRYNGSNNDGYYDGLSLVGDVPLSISTNSITIPEEIKLHQNFPNPFNPSTTIRFSIPSVTQNGVEGSLVTLRVYDVLGNEVATLVNEDLPAGEYEVEFNLPAGRQGTSSIKHHPSSGVYFYQLKVGKYIDTKKMVFLK